MEDQQQQQVDEQPPPQPMDQQPQPGPLFPDPILIAPEMAVIPPEFIAAGLHQEIPGGEPQVGNAAAFNAAVIQHELRNIRGELHRGYGIKPPTFSSGTSNDWLPFMTRFRRAMTANGWDERRAKHELICGMAGAAAEMTDDIEMDDQEPYEAFRLRVEARFMPLVDSQKNKALFFEAKQKAGETTHRWHSRLRVLHARAWGHHHNRDQAPDLIYRFIRGMTVAYIRGRVAEANPNTYTAALAAANLAESAMITAGGAPRDFHGINHVANFPPNLRLTDEGFCEVNMVADAKLRDSDRDPREFCWNCGDKKHKRDTCPNPKQKCASCNNFTMWRGKGRLGGEKAERAEKKTDQPAERPAGTKGIGPGSQRKVNAIDQEN